MAHAEPTTQFGGLARAQGIVGCAALTALGAQLAIPLPFTPVPVTWQVPMILFAGLTLGARGALASLSLYIAAGLAGAPVFAFGRSGLATLLGPTGGYLVAMPVAAWVVGRIAERGRHDAKQMAAACAAGLAVLYAGGVAWLGLLLHLSPAQALLQGAGWFLLWDVTKSLIVIALVRGRAAYLRPANHQ